MSDEPSPAARLDARSRILDSASRLLRDGGLAAVTTRAVAQHAGVQAPMIYRLFGDKDGLLDAVAEHLLALYVAQKSSAAELASSRSLDPVAELRAGWQTQIEFGLANSALFARMSDPARSVSSPAARSAQQLLRTRVHHVAASGRLRVSEPRAVGLLRAAGSGAVSTMLQSAPEDRDEGLAEAIFEAVLREILTEHPEPERSSPIAAAVTVRAVASDLGMLTDAEQRLLGEWLDRAIAGLEPGPGRAGA